MQVCCCGCCRCDVLTCLQNYAARSAKQLSQPHFEIYVYNPSYAVVTHQKEDTAGQHTVLKVDHAHHLTCGKKTFTILIGIYCKIYWRILIRNATLRWGLEVCLIAHSWLYCLLVLMGLPLPKVLMFEHVWSKFCGSVRLLCPMLFTSLINYFSTH